MRGCRPFSDEEIGRVMDRFQGRHALRDRAFFVLGLKTGLRCRELLGLRIGDVWRGRILDRVEVPRRVTKGKRAGFSLPIHPAARAAVGRYIQARCSKLPPEAPLFWSAKGTQKGLRALDRSSAWRRLKKAFRAAGVEGNTGTHSLRKTFCSKVYHALQNDLIATQAAMHHRSITSTIRYLSFDAAAVEMAILAA
jgi:integrase